MQAHENATGDARGADQKATQVMWPEHGAMYALKATNNGYYAIVQGMALARPGRRMHVAFSCRV